MHACAGPILYRYIVSIQEIVLIPATVPCYSHLNLLSMLLVFEMHFKILNRHARSRRV